MADLRRLTVCFSFVLFIICGVVILGLVVKRVGAVQPESIELISQVGDGSSLEAISASSKVYFPYVERPVILVCGEIGVDTTWTAVEGPYKIICDVVVKEGATLNITAGTRIDFMHSNDNLIIYGAMNAIGTEQDPVTFQPVYGSTPGSWGAVAFLPGSSGLLDHAILEYGGGGYVWYGQTINTMLHISSDAVRVSNSVIMGSANSGLYIGSASPVIEASHVLSNTGVYGAGMNIYYGNPLIQNNILEGNIAYMSGGAIRIVSASPSIWNNVFLNNQAGYGGEGGGSGIDVYQESTPCHPSIQNNLLMGNSNAGSAVIQNSYCSPDADYNNFWNNIGEDYSGMVPGGHDIFVDPLWVHPSTGNYHLGLGSPCIDAGSPYAYAKIDLDGEPRPMGLAPDIGLDEVRNLYMAMTSPMDETSPESTVAYELTLENMLPVSLTNVLLTDTLPIEAAFVGYQSDGLTCLHDGSVWGGQLSCTPDSLTLAPAERRDLTVTVTLTDDLLLDNYVINTALATAQADGEAVAAQSSARIRITWCAVQLNDIPMGNDIQAAIDASSQVSDVVKVSGYCQFDGSVVLNKTLILQGGWGFGYQARNSTLYPTTLDANGMSRVITVSGGPSVAPVIDGFTITGGYMEEMGGGIAIFNSNPTIQNNVIKENAAYYGGGLSIDNGSPIVQNNIILANSVIPYQVSDVSGGGIYIKTGSPTIVNNIVTENASTVFGGGIMFVHGGLVMDYNDVWNNYPENYYGTNPGLHDISTEPLFVDPENGDYHLAPDSPCMDAGSPDQYSLDDFDGDRRPMRLASDIGVDEVLGFRVEKVGTQSSAAPGEPLTYTIELSNPTGLALGNVQLTDTLPEEVALTSFQTDGMTCEHTGSTWGGQLTCNMVDPSLLPGESASLTIFAQLTDNFTVRRVIVNAANATASAGGDTFTARDLASTLVTWCEARLNDTPIGSGLQAAIDAASQPGDVVKVSGYCPVQELIVNKDLTLQGGWGYGFSAWDPDVYTTTLDGQRMARVMLVDGNIAPTIEHFVITGGRTDDFGGGIYVPAGSPTIRNNHLQDNNAKSGAGLYVGTGSPSIVDNIFSGNIIPIYEGLVDCSGGGIYNGSGNPTIQHNIFHQNFVSRCYRSNGGGLYNESGNPVIQDNIFSSNISDYFSIGGGLYNQSGSPVIQDNLFDSNIASLFGGGVATFGGMPVIENNTFVNNRVSDCGGGVGVEGSTEPVLVQNNIFIDNSSGRGGGLCIFHTSALVQNNIVYENIAYQGGGGIYIADETTDSVIQNNTIYSNTASSGGGVYIGSGSAILRSNIVVRNTAWEQGGGIYYASGTLTLRFNNVWDNNGGDYYNITPGPHSISADPNLADPANGNFHLLSTSPCINKADPVNFPPTDFEGQVRPRGAAPDIGADEY